MGMAVKGVLTHISLGRCCLLLSPPSNKTVPPNHPHPTGLLPRHHGWAQDCGSGSAARPRGVGRGGCCCGGRCGPRAGSSAGGRRGCRHAGCGQERAAAGRGEPRQGAWERNSLKTSHRPTFRVEGICLVLPNSRGSGVFICSCAPIQPPLLAPCPTSPACSPSRRHTRGLRRPPAWLRRRCRPSC